MKRYWLFMYPSHYPSGGMQDFAGSFDTIKEAADYVNAWANCELSGVREFSEHWEIFDSETKVIVSANKLPYPLSMAAEGTYTYPMPVEQYAYTKYFIENETNGK